MSREFGSCAGGYFHTQINDAAGDCLGGNDELTRLWGKFLLEFYPVAYAIASSEAGNTGSDYPIIKCMEQWASIRDAIDEIDNYLDPYRRVANQAVSDADREWKNMIRGQHED